MAEEHIVSSLGKTWIFDLDGTLVKHNGYKIDGRDTWLDGALEFLRKIPEEDKLVLLTSRTEQERELTERFLESFHVRYDALVFNMPYGERILVNDDKPSGLGMALAVRTKRDVFMEDSFKVDQTL